MGRIGVLFAFLIGLAALAAVIFVPVRSFFAMLWRVVTGRRRRVDEALRRVDGFQLIEAMIVVAVIGILAAIAIPLYNHVQCRNAIAQGEQRAGCEAMEARAQGKPSLECGSEGFITDVSKFSVRITCR